LIILVIIALAIFNQDKQETKQIAKDAKFTIGNQMKKVDFFPKAPLDYTIQSQKSATSLYPGSIVNADYCCDNSCSWQCSGSYDYCYNWCNVDLCPGKSWCDEPIEECEPGYFLVDDGICCPNNFPAYCSLENPPCYQSHWSCGNWEQCQNSQQTRNCGQNNQCATDSNKPPTTQSCTCTESWSCGLWQDCIGGTQTRGCSDLNNCGTALNKPLTSQSCACVELWSCSAWSSCFSNQQTRVCTDNHQCGTTSMKPVESQSCMSNYASFITAKNDYTGGIISFQNFLAKSNEWINLPVTITASVSYQPSSFNMNNGCSGAIKLSPNSDYNLKVCLVGASSLSEIVGSCKIYTSGEYGAGSTLSTNPTGINSGNYKVRVKWTRIKDPSGRYDHGGESGAGSPSQCGSSKNTGIVGESCSGGGNTKWESQLKLYSSSSCTGTIYYPYKCSTPSCRIYEGGEGQIGAGSSCVISGQLTSSTCLDISGYSSDVFSGQCIIFPYNNMRYLKDYANQAPTANQYYSSCTEGITSCPSTICTYAGDNIEYTTSFYIGSQSGTSSASFTQNKIISTGTLGWS